jgi:hypothetical protein
MTREMRPTSALSAPRFARGLLMLAVSAASFVGCDNVAQDDFRSQGGISPDPTAVVTGTVLYKGPQPSCDYERGKPVRVRGRVALLLFQYDNPPPPQGRATSVENVMFVNGDSLFSLEDCAPADTPIDDRAELTRTTDFRWPQLELYADARAYQVRGFFDADENMNPFFSVTRLPTRGDVIGAAVDDAQAAVPVMTRLELPAFEAARDGYVKDNVLVTLGRVVRTERPAFRLGETRSLSSESRLEIPVDAQKLQDELALCLKTPYACVDRAQLLGDMRDASCASAGQSGADCDLSLHALAEDEVATSFARAGLSPSFAPEDRAFFATPVDMKTVRSGAVDLPVPDGLADPHPLLGASANVPWYGPIVLMQRQALDADTLKRERAAAIPDVVLIGSVLLDETGAEPIASAFADTVPFAVPAIAAVVLDPSRSDCRVPYVPPGNVTNAYETVFTQCSELPTGVYAVNVFAGVAGGARSDDARSEVGFVYTGGQDSGQSWSLPNELADPVQVGDDAVLPHQGSRGLFVVHDPHPDATGDCEKASDPAAELLGSNALVEVEYRGLCTDDEPALYEAGPGVDAAGCLPAGCCDAVRHLCGVPLCPLCDEASCPELAAAGLAVRRGPSAVQVPRDGGPAVPDCVPFAMPTACCN